MFSRDIFTLNTDTVAPQIIHSYIKTCTSLAGVLLLENNKTFGRTENKKRLLYKCVPDDIHLPIFLIPYDIKLGFSKVIKNKYVVFQFDHWSNKHPQGILTETLGDVDNLEVFYEYQLYCKSLHVSLTEFTNKTKIALSEKTNAEYIDQILHNPDFNISDYRDKYVFTIDPQNSVDFDDGFSIEEVDDGHRITIYIANVFLWLETLKLWNSFSRRVSTIYLPDRRRPMLPTILSDILCSLQQDQPRFALAMEIIVDCAGKINSDKITYKNVLISVKRNYVYEHPKMVEKDKHYKELLNVTQKMDNSITNSHDVVSHLMICMNAYSGVMLANNKTGIFRSAHYINNDLKILPEYNTFSEDAVRLIQSWNNTSGQYILFDTNANLDHELMRNNINSSKSMNSYIHITSPIRRLVDLLNQIILFKKLNIVRNISVDAGQFLKNWTDQLDYINTAMRSIRKIQTDSEILNRCFNDPIIMEKEHAGIVFDKIIKNDGTMHYMVYLEQLKMLSRVHTSIDVPNYSHNKFKVFLFEDEDKVKKKIRLQIVL
jgi:exoribonuclease R